MIDDKNMNPNDNFYQYFEMEDGNEETPPCFSDALQVGAPALIFKIMDELKIRELFRKDSWKNGCGFDKRFDKLYDYQGDKCNAALFRFCMEPFD